MATRDNHTFMLWFDVGVKRYTTNYIAHSPLAELWFDVGVKRYTTNPSSLFHASALWFDVGVKRYTTPDWTGTFMTRCGLM